MEAVQQLEAKKNFRKLYICWKKEIYFLYMWTPTVSENSPSPPQKPSTTICKIAQNFMTTLPPLCGRHKLMTPYLHFDLC